MSESVQEAFLLLDVLSQMPSLKPWQKYALIVHCINLHSGFRCTGFQEDDSKPEEGGN